VAALRALNLSYSARARSQLLAIQAYIQERDPAAAQRRAGRSDDTREWVVRGLPYVIVYEADQQGVMVLGVFHAAQDRDDEND
jgi:plasmid stabilization system protein ParE